VSPVLIRVLFLEEKMNKKNVFMFSGQGSQYYQMGKGLYQTEPQFRKWMDELDRIAKRMIGTSIIETIYEEEKKVYEVFSRTLLTNPAIYMVEMALAQTLIDYGIQPDCVVGASLGEFASATIAGMISHEKGLELAIKQAVCLERTCPPGSIIAVFGKPELCEQVDLIRQNSELVAISSETHFVISGSEKSLESVCQYLKENSFMHQKLPVSHGFHSFNIDPAYPSFHEIIKAEKIGAPQIPFISSLYGREVYEIQPEYFWQVIRKPILFREALESLNSDAHIYNFIDLGPTGTLANIAKHYHNGSLQQSQLFPIMTQYLNEVDNIHQVQRRIPIRENKMPLPKKDPVAYLFPGQGAQKIGMGEGLFDEYKELTEKADHILGYSIKDLCLQNPENKLRQTQFTQPALYSVNVLTYLKKLDMGAKKPDYVAGHSLGEYCALFAAGAFDFETGLKLVQKRGQLMANAKAGGMAAIIGMTEWEIENALSSHDFQNIDIANVNSPSQIVISGPKQDIVQAQAVFEGQARYIVLNVSGAFHSRLMVDTWREFGQYIQQFDFCELKIPVISNVLARPYTNDNIKQLLTDQIIHSVKWTDSIRYLMEQNVYDFVEVGPGNILSKLIAEIKTPYYAKNAPR
jgi:trans-AT polyketide synthase/acyltransferase/oxidoreductase domain-containing protein